MTRSGFAAALSLLAVTAVSAADHRLLEIDPSAQRAATKSAVPRTIEDRFLDWVQLTDSADRSIETPVYLRLFTADTAELGTGGDGGKDTRAAEAKTVQGQGPALLRDSFITQAGKDGLKAVVDESGANATVPDGAIVIEGKFVTIDPGSRAKRYLVGFGAGKSAIEISGTFRTPAGETLGEFRHRRIGAMGMGGGDSLGKLLADSRSCGEDLAKFVHAWLTNRLK